MSASTGTTIWHALIRTHHITSRKKVAKLKQAAAVHDVFVLLRSGSSPGIMYVEGRKSGVEDWVVTVQKLRYKDYQLAAQPDATRRECDVDVKNMAAVGLYETESVREFGRRMQARGVFEWWRRGMGYSGPGERF
ncbi:hypothetical protein Tdes44962_MAKER06466 [Teratosphaeria destructans]|uniref:Uncharacterized protein n=1 Tax=Teratosphaeria destructans TaxID=418781 RepID=A0A9W7W7P6_9PEZI|nr:hypothetical protein Tdes44962_MAKER06466 [Teratosphaeria destructans]